MYSTCLFCHASLGANDSIEHFPIGRRLAFDAAKGRLWVVCRRCERWNLTPLEERWEAIEECEREFVATRLRASTDNVGLARLREGLELVRIGAPQRPEMAAWRYGDQFGRRRRRHLAWTGVGFAVATGLIVVGPATGVIAGGGWGLYNLANFLQSAYQQHRVRARIELPAFARPVLLRDKQLGRTAIVADEGGWGLRVMFEVPPEARPPRPSYFRYENAEAQARRLESTVTLAGDDALRTAGKLLPAINESGAKRAEVSSAVEIVAEETHPDRLFARYAGRPTKPARRQPPYAGEAGHIIATLPKEIRLALEMASHEESERRALEGELAILEAAWRQAEEIASIADDLFVTDDERAKLESLRAANPADPD